MEGTLLAAMVTFEGGAPGSEQELSVVRGLWEASSLESFCTHKRWDDGGLGDILHFLHSLQQSDEEAFRAAPSTIFFF